MTVKLPSMTRVINLVRRRINVVFRMIIYHLKFRRDCVPEVNSCAQGTGEGALSAVGAERQRGKMSDDRLPPVEDLLDLSFPSLALQHMDLKQWELDTAAAKVDELSLQLQRLWSDGPPPPPPHKDAPPPIWSGGGTERPSDPMGAFGGGPPPPPPPPYELHGLYPSIRTQGGAEGHRVGLQPWRESALDGGKAPPPGPPPPPPPHPKKKPTQKRKTNQRKNKTRN